MFIFGGTLTTKGLNFLPFSLSTYSDLHIIISKTNRNINFTFVQFYHMLTYLKIITYKNMEICRGLVINHIIIVLGIFKIILHNLLSSD